MKRRCRRRFGCFKVPFIKGARVVKAAARNDVTWLGRTDPALKEVELSSEWNRLSPDEKRYIVAHEQAHLEAGTDHNERFYDHLKRLIEKHKVPWKVAYNLESFNCHAKH